MFYNILFGLILLGGISMGVAYRRTGSDLAVALCIIILASAPTLWIFVQFHYPLLLYLAAAYAICISLEVLSWYFPINNRPSRRDSSSHHEERERQN